MTEDWQRGEQDGYDQPVVMLVSVKPPPRAPWWRRWLAALMVQWRGG